MSRARRRALQALTLSFWLVVIVGCGSGESPSAAAPELAEALGEVDDALANGNYSRAEKALDQLVGATEDAAQDGEISEADAGRIIDAAEELMARLPETQDVDPADDIPPPADETPPADDEGKEAKDEEKDEEKEDEGKEEKEDKDEDAEQNGNGHSSENGPDDGHGN